MSYINHYPGMDKIDRADEIAELSQKRVSINDNITVIVVATSNILDSSALIHQLNLSLIPYINKASDVSQDDFIFRDKLKYYIESLKDVTTPYVLLLDALDVVILKDLDQTFIDIFESYDKDIIYNATPSRFPRREYYPKEPADATTFLNAGVCIGKINTLIDFYERAYELSLDKLSESEQHYVKIAWQEYDNVGVDYETKLFTCHHKNFHTIPELMDTLSIYKPTKLFYSSDSDYYDCFLKTQSQKTDITVPENVSIILTDDDGYLIDQLNNNNILYHSIENLDNIDSEYALITSSKSVFVHSIDEYDINQFIKSGRDALFGATSIGTPAMDYEHQRHVFRCLEPTLIFGRTEYLKELFSKESEENSFENMWLNQTENIDIDVYEDFFTTATYNDTTIKNGKIDHHAEYPWIKKEDGFHYVD